MLKTSSYGLLLLEGDGATTFFQFDHFTGTYSRDAGDQHFYTIAETTQYFTLTDKFGSSLKFKKDTPATGTHRLEARFDPSGNERRYEYYTSGADTGKLRYITDIPTGNRTEFPTLAA